MIAYNLATNEEHAYLPNVLAPEDAVCFSYCLEHGLSVDFLEADLNSTLAAFKEQLPVTRGTKSIACGDWTISIDRPCDCCGGPHYDYDEHPLMCDPCNPNIPDLNPRNEAK